MNGEIAIIIILISNSLTNRLNEKRIKKRKSQIHAKFFIMR